jgi:hypothetical protein
VGLTPVPRVRFLFGSAFCCMGYNNQTYPPTERGENRWPNYFVRAGTDTNSGGSSGGQKASTNGCSSMTWTQARLTPSRWSAVLRAVGGSSVRILVWRHLPLASVRGPEPTSGPALGWCEGPAGELEGGFHEGLATSAYFRRAPNGGMPTRSPRRPNTREAGALTQRGCV